MPMTEPSAVPAEDPTAPLPLLSLPASGPRDPRAGLSGVSPEEVVAWFAGRDQPAFRARQLADHVWSGRASDFDDVHTLPGRVRAELAETWRIDTLTRTEVREADGGLTHKALHRLDDGRPVESVLMRYPARGPRRERATLCISSQAGCAMGCVFCATGRLGLLRNLSPGEIVEQVLWAARELRTLTADHRPPIADPQSALSVVGRRSSVVGLTNVVFMGMGEPFANYDRWWRSVERLHDPQGFNMGARSLTVSTVGLVPGIRRLAEETLPINLAISLHAPDDELRSEMMPINRRYPIAALLEATRDYIAKTNRRVSFEYVLLQGKNDSPEQAAELAGRLQGMLCHVNLIPWNPVPGAPLGRSERARVLRFQQALQERGIACTVRVERGVAIAAACGQLAGVTTSEPIAVEA
jgi:23S rRNA (adenine2503-C2)-methyltransferase